VKGIEVLEHALRASPSSVVVAEPFLFNLCEFVFLHCVHQLHLTGLCLSSYSIRAQVRRRIRKEERAFSRCRKVEWGWAKNQLFEDACKLTDMNIVDVGHHLSWSYFEALALGAVPGSPTR